MRAIIYGLLIILGMTAAPSAAQDRKTPYWATLRAQQVNMRVGPSVDFPIEWVYQRPGLPVKVVRVNQGWRLVEDLDGDRGWIVARLLSPERSGVIIGADLAEMRATPDLEAKLLWRAEPGVVGKLGDCQSGWCELNIDGRKGWIVQERIWGAGEP